MSSYQVTFSLPKSKVEYQLNSETAVPINRFGSDHWTTLAYIETVAVDHNGVINPDKMRISGRRHPMLATMKPSSLSGVGFYDNNKEYPTRIKSEEFNREQGRWDAEDLPNHDDYDCVSDLIKTGLLQVEMPRLSNNVFVDFFGKPCLDQDGDAITNSFVTGMTEQTLMAYAKFSLTPRGHAVATEYRAWRAAGNNSHQFSPSAAALHQPEVERTVSFQL